MLRRATENDRRALQALWQVSFHDAPEEIERFFRFHAEKADVFVAQDVSGVQAALYGLPCTLQRDGQAVAARYLYAVATAPERRGQGMMRRLIPFAHDQMERSGVRAFWLYPADKGLMTFYEPFGYRAVLSSCRRTVSAEPADLPVAPLTAADAFAMRKALLSHRSAVEWDANALAYAAEFYDAAWYRVGEALALVQKTQDTLTVAELLAENPTLAARALCTRLHAVRAELTLPFWCGGEACPRPMLRIAGEGTGGVYAGLELS